VLRIRHVEKPGDQNGRYGRRPKAAEALLHLPLRLNLGRAARASA